MAHRGPDDSGVWISGDCRVGLAHRRLSIIDLSAAGRQPMHYGAGRYHIVFNGEIYNYIDLGYELKKKGYHFSSSSDTEVVLASYNEWGYDCLNKLNGMFAFGLFDSVKRSLFLARDRAGEKPLFYRQDNDGISFASELKALMADPDLPRQLDPVALDCYLAFGYVSGQRCILKGVNKLPPAHALTFDTESGQTRIWKYWSLPEARKPGSVNTQKDEDELTEELENLLEDSVRRQLVADVPVGILLSGGVDSSLTTAMAVRNSSRVKTFTIRFPGSGSYDETEHARLVANHFGTNHIELEASPSTVDLLPVLAAQFDEPVIDSSMVPTFLVSRLVKKHCTVALGGDGGDELFGGYEHHSRLLWLQKSLGWMPHILRKQIADSASRLMPLGLKGRNWLQALDVDFRNGLPSIATYFDSTNRAKLLHSDVLAQIESQGRAESIRAQIMPRTGDLVQRATRMDFENYLPEDILVKVDRASMLNSLEIRAPWLDYRLVEFAFERVPSQLKASTTQRKILPKKLSARILPKQFDTTRKQGFSIPLASWLKKDQWKNFFREVLLDSSSKLFSRDMVESLLAGQTVGRSNSERLFGLVMFTLWQKEYNVSA